MSTLESFRIGDGDPYKGVPDGPKVQEAFKAPHPKNKRVLAFDQSIANTGWALVAGINGHLRIFRTGMIMTAPDPALGKLEDKLQRGVRLYREARRAIVDNPCDLVVTELPLGGFGGGRAGADSSLLANMALAIALEEAGVEHVVRYQTRKVKHYLTGNGDATKVQMASALEQRFPQLKVMKVGPMNEHTRDAIAMALHYLET